MEEYKMRLNEFRALFLVVTAILALFVASPALSRLLVLPPTESFTEMWILGQNHKAEGYPFNVSGGQSYSVFLGIRNHLGYLAYYLVEVKFRNQTQSAPNSLNRTSSSLPSLFNITAFVGDGGTWELPVTFSLDYEYNRTLGLTNLHRIILNGAELDMHEQPLLWNPKNNSTRGSLFFELWILDSASSSFRFHERYVDLWFNLTSP
jgi:uncharacterized membrane protein